MKTVELNQFVLVILCIVVVIIFAIASNMSYNDEVQEENLYCEMVQTYKQSNGQYGWPAYRTDVKCKE